MVFVFIPIHMPNLTIFLKLNVPLFSSQANPDTVQQGVRVNTVCPAMVDTALMGKISGENFVHQPQIAQMIIQKVGTMT